MELEEKLRITNEIKKLQDSILVSDQVALFMKKFDSSRSSNVNRKSRKSSVYDRVGKRIENARDYIK